MIETFENTPEEKKRLLIDTMMLITFIVVIIFLILIFFQIKDKKSECFRDPILYTTKHLEKMAGGNITCTCLTDNPQAFIPGEGRGYKYIFGSFDEE